MICFPNAKINLGLNIVSKRNDGYHNLETIFYPLMIKDALEIIIKDGLHADVLIQSGIVVDGNAEDNLVMKSLRLMRSKYEIPPIEVHLLKGIPFGAGLGGGSADASFMLKLLNDTFGLMIPDDELAGFAVQLGADCPFFIYNRPLFAGGIGDEFENVDISLTGYNFILIKPDIHVATKDAFSQIEPKQPDISLKQIIRHPVAEWRELMINDFEKSVFAKYPEISFIKERLYDLGAVYASMSGSGSSVYALFDTRIENVDSLFPGCYVWQGKGC